ncbi:RNA exonuclease Ngl2p [Trichomonascus vanleenenianus]|uniref:RNA exonuclease n=1 Tax=Trichomonascus vanleenenianus TaxID=2268995 RepID=UPI003EC99A40
MGPAGSNKKRPDFVTPEYIAEMRALREAKKKLKASTTEKPEEEEDISKSYITRPMLKLPGASPGENGKTFKIMTYNALAQCLIRRDLFPDNGDALKWKWRGKALASEIEHYCPDILCMQEVDKDKAESFFAPELDKIGMATEFRTPEDKNHGNIIAYKKDLFELDQEVFINYDEIATEKVPLLTVTKNSGMIVALRFKDAPTKGVFVGTTHMFWHPYGSYERTRQLAVFLDKAIEFKKTSGFDWPVFLAGDFNSECFDTPYLSATTRPAKLDDAAAKILVDSLDYFAQPGSKEKSDALVELFNRQSHKAISLYNSYKLVHPENVHPKGSGEPIFSNWAHTWRGLLDYIFVLQPTPEPVSEGYVATEVKLLELLRMPMPDEMGPEPSGQPRVGQFPSDHLCLMATVLVSNIPTR